MQAVHKGWTEFFDPNGREAEANMESPNLAPRVAPSLDSSLDPPEAFQPGAVVAGKYRVERKLAEGGMGVVLVATHLALKQRVAIKVMHQRLLGNASIVERFRREAQLAASIRSGHVVRVYDVGVLDNGAPYMVMEYLEGEDLGGALSRGPLAVEVAVDYVLQACDAIAEAHAIGIVHRDLKPENLFLARRSGGGTTVKILDFGISKASRKRDADGARLPRMTEDSERFGTPVYMPPEQLLSSANVDSRADIWALGVVLFELLTGHLPFAGEEMTHLCASILSAPATPLRERCAGASAELEAILLKCLQKDPACRYRNVAELAQELAVFGSPVSQHQLEAIKRIVREGGASIRPPRISDAILPPRQPALTVEEAFTLPIGSARSGNFLGLALLGTVGVALIVALAVALASSKSAGNQATGAAASMGLVAEPAPLSSLSLTSGLSGVSPAPSPHDSPPPVQLSEPARPRADAHPLRGPSNARVAVRPPASARSSPSSTPVPSPRPLSAADPFTTAADPLTADHAEFGERR
jgi:serine/threonine protein kinase